MVLFFLVGEGRELGFKLFLAKTNLVVCLTETLPENCNILLYIFKLCPVKPVYNLCLSYLWQSCLFTLWSVGFQLEQHEKYLHSTDKTEWKKRSIWI